MDSLLANYVSSDNESDEDPKQQSPYITSHETCVVGSLFPQQPNSSSSIFFSLPPPKKNYESNSQTLPIPCPSNPNPKRIVQFRPPINPSSFVADEDDDEVEQPVKECQSSLQTPSMKSFMSFLPPPKNLSSLGAAPILGLGRRSFVDAEVPSADPIVSCNSNVEKDESHCIDESSSTPSVPKENIITDGDFFSNTVPISENLVNHNSVGNSENYESDWNNDLSLTMPQTNESAIPLLPRKRGRDDIPLDIVEVNQDDLMKNRPKEHQVKATGIAFGPSYQPVSTKGMPSKLHKRKHQIGSLYFDMKQKAAELAERRSKGFLTKAETQAKYGW